MPLYEAAIIFKSAARPDLVAALKRTCSNVISKGGMLRKMENLGYKELPHTIKTKGDRFTRGSYILLRFDAPPESLADLKRDCAVDKDILKAGFMRQKPEPPKPCEHGPCLFGELKNPDHDIAAYRKSVIRNYKNRK